MSIESMSEMSRYHQRIITMYHKDLADSGRPDTEYNTKMLRSITKFVALDELMKISATSTDTFSVHVTVPSCHEVMRCRRECAQNPCVCESASARSARHRREYEQHMDGARDARDAAVSAQGRNTAGYDIGPRPPGAVFTLPAYLDAQRAQWSTGGAS